MKLEKKKKGRAFQKQSLKEKKGKWKFYGTFDHAEIVLKDFWKCGKNIGV